jgi:hypothetical protein
MRAHGRHDVFPRADRAVVDRRYHVARAQSRALSRAAGNQVSDDGGKRGLISRQPECAQKIAIEIRPP